MLALQQNTEEWIEFRKGKIGASDSPIIMGVSPWKSSYDLWLEKLGLSEVYTNEAMQRGHRFEASARFEFELENNFSVEPKVLVHPEYEWMIASLDGISEDGKKIVEIKCPGKDDHSQALSGKIPEKYYPQLQHQIEVSGVEKAYYFSWTTDTFVTLILERDDDYIKSMIEKEKEFYECLQQLIPPPLSNKDYVRRNDELWREASERWRNAKLHLNELEKIEKELRQTLIHLASDRNCMGAGVKVVKTARRGPIEYKDIPELVGVNLENYRKPNVTCWRLTENGT